MVRELLEQRADLAIADLTITFDREQVSYFIKNYVGNVFYLSMKDVANSQRKYDFGIHFLFGLLKRKDEA